MLILFETLTVVFILYMLFRYLFISQTVNISKPVAITILTILTIIFLLLPAPIKAMLTVLAIITFAVWLAFYVEYNNNQSKMMQFIRKWL